MLADTAWQPSFACPQEQAGLGSRLRGCKGLCPSLTLSPKPLMASPGLQEARGTSCCSTMAAALPAQPPWPGCSAAPLQLRVLCRDSRPRSRPAL